jgi:hypothetical protein
MGRPVDEIEDAGLRQSPTRSRPCASPRRRVRRSSSPATRCARPARARRAAGADLDAGLRLRALSIATLAVTRDPESGIQNMGTYRAGLKATDRLGAHGRAHRRRRLSALAQAQ